MSGESTLAASSLVALSGASYEEATQTLRAVAERATGRVKCGPSCWKRHGVRLAARPSSLRWRDCSAV